MNIFYIAKPLCITAFKAIVMRKGLPYNDFAVRERLCKGDFCGENYP